MKITTQERPLPPVSPYLDKKQASAYLGVGVEYIEDLIRSGRLKALKPSYKILRIHVRDLDALMNGAATIAS
jgi:excisionase family DNA binding protein